PDPAAPALVASLSVRQPCSSTPLPYTTLFRSRHRVGSRRRLSGKARPCWPGLFAPGMPHAVGAWPQRDAPGRDLGRPKPSDQARSEEHTSELQSRENLVCRLLLEQKSTRDWPT